jgi:hypothetical protein
MPKNFTVKMVMVVGIRKCAIAGGLITVTATTTIALAAEHRG